MVFAEALTEYLIDGLADGLAHTDEPTRPIPLAVDRYIALSAFQKAIRRGNEELALRAAATLTINGPKAIWRRLGIIAFEDVGVANLDAVGWVTAVIDDVDLRQRLGDEWKIADYLIRTLCRSAKCRATDDIIDVIQHDPELAELRDELPGLSLRHRISSAIDCTRSIEARGLATWLAIGTDKITSSTLAPVPGCPENTFDALRDADYPGSVVEICRMGLKRTGCMLPPMFLLLYPLRGSGQPVAEDDLMPPETKIGDVPSWVFDVHTRSGLTAFGRYRRRSERMKAFLAEHAGPSANLNRIVGGLVFRVESGLLKNRLIWDEGQRLRRAADLFRPGLVTENVPQGLAIVRDEIDLLNRCRAGSAPDYLR